MFEFCRLRGYMLPRPPDSMSSWYYIKGQINTKQKNAIKSNRLGRRFELQSILQSFVMHP